MIKAKKKYIFKPEFAIPPGETLREFMETQGMTQRELASRTGLTEQSLIRIFKGRQAISVETANKLELVTSMPAGMWNNLEVQYREQLAKILEKEKLKADLDWLKSIPTKELVDRKVLKDTKDKVELLRDALRFFGVSSIKAWHNTWATPKVAAKRSSCFETRIGAAAAWIRLGEIEAHSITCSNYNKDVFYASLLSIRDLTTEKLDVFIPKMRELCANSGVALSLIPEFKKVPWNGATKWLSPKKAMILLNLRGKTEDKFWFSFFHEAGHVLNDSKKWTYINDESLDNQIEKDADEFAADILIPREWDDEISLITRKSQISHYAKKLNISPGIVAGRYQHLTENWSFFNKFKRTFKWLQDK